MHRWVILAVVSLSVLRAGTLGAQSLYPWSIQGSALYVGLGGEAYTELDTGYGFEAQVRYNLLSRPLSFGLGVQFSSHPPNEIYGEGATFQLAGAFLEPRLVIDIKRPTIAPYLSSRLAVLRQSSEFEGLNDQSTGVQVNVGGGVLLNVNPRVNVDAGVTYGVVWFGDLTVTDQYHGDVSKVPVGSGNNLVLRLGLAIGVGR